MKSVESNAFVILWCLCTILCIKNQHAEVTCQNPLGFLTSGGVRWGVPYGEKKTGPGPCFVNIAAPRNLEAEILSFLEVCGPAPEVKKPKGF